MNIIENMSITTPKGFKSSGVSCGLKKGGKKDIALIVSDNVATASGMYTTNVVKGHSLKLTMKHIEDNKAKAILLNSSNANACVGEKGDNDALEIATSTANLLGCDVNDILVGSTGVIGQLLNMPLVISGINDCYKNLSTDGGHDSAVAIMTTDLVSKECGTTIDIDGATVTIAGMAKGSGMIHPNMATMFGILTTDANISSDMLDKALKTAVNKSFNRVSVDGDMSVCDMTLILANGQAENNIIDTENDHYNNFLDALTEVCINLAKKLANDGEGATKLIEISVKGAKNSEDAYKVVSTIARSPLVKTMVFGEDANLGRILTATGYSGADIDPDTIDLFINSIPVCKDGIAVQFDEDKAKKELEKHNIYFDIDLKQGNYSDKMWTCDFSYDYVKINGSYRS